MSKIIYWAGVVISVIAGIIILTIPLIIFFIGLWLADKYHKLTCKMCRK